MEELLQELADGEPEGHVMETAGTAAEKKGSVGGPKFILTGAAHLSSWKNWSPGRDERRTGLEENQQQMRRFLS